MPLKVVYLDDEVDLLALFKTCFESPEITIKTFSVANEALEFIEKNLDIDLVILDYRLRETTGDKVAERLPSRLKKIIITGELSLIPPPGIERVFYKPLAIREIRDYLNSLKVKSA
jgi:CheY-like chemotaxis protein